MKISAITRIIIYCLLIAILSGILFIGITADSFSWDFFSINAGGSVSGLLKDGTEAAGKSFDADRIDEIVIIWVSGNVNISGSEDSQISYQTKNNNTEFETVYKLENGRLSIGFNGQKWNTGKVKSKDLSLRLPQNWDGKLLKVEAVSADVTIEKLSNLQELKTENVSGKINVRSVISDKLDVNTVSGDMYFHGRFEKIDIEGVSARCTIDASAACPKTIDMDTVSGDLTLYLPEDYGFDLKLDGVSKSLNTNLPYEKDGNRYQCSGKLGKCQIDMESVSGGISISTKKLDQASCSHLWSEGTLMITPGSNAEEMVYTCLLCDKTKSEMIAQGKLYTITCADAETERRLVEPLMKGYPAGSRVCITTNIVIDADLHLYVNGEFACKYTPETINDTQYWLFSFFMPAEDVTIELKVVGGK